MTDLDDRVRTLLETRAHDVSVDPAMPRSVATRSQRRRALVGGGAGLVAAVVIVLGVAALPTVIGESNTGSTPTPSVSPSPAAPTWRGIWPQATRAEAEDAQAAADAGEHGAAWQVNVVEVLRRYARQELGFAEVHFDDTLDIAEDDSPGPYTVHVVSCEPRDLVEWPPVCTEQGDHTYSEITVERLLRADRTGIWSVTDAAPVEPVAIEGGAAPAPPVPATFVGYRGGEIVLVDVSSGATVRVLVDRATLGGGSAEGGVVDLELSPDGSTLYFVALGTPERIMSVPVAGGEPTFVAEGRKPTLSPDGTKLAFLDCRSEFVGCGNAIRVRDLASGSTRMWDVGTDTEFVGQMAWMDARSLAFTMFYTGDSNPTMHMLDTLDGVGVELRTIEEIGPSDPDTGWTVAGYHVPTEGFVVRHYCCTSSAADEVEESTVLSVAWNGQVVATLFEPADWLDIELDGSGRHFLVADQGLDVYRLDGSGAPAFVAGGFEDVDW